MSETTFEIPLPRAVAAAAARADKLVQEQAAAPDTATVVVDPPEPAPAPAPEPVDEWKQRYMTLQGKYDAEVPSLTARLSGMEALIANIRPVVAAEAPATQPPVPVSVSPEDAETFGEDLIAAARRWARAEVAQDLDRVTSQVTHLVGKVAELTGTTRMTQADQVRSATMDALDKLPDIGGIWRETNNTQAFINWLQGNDMFSGQKRHDLLTQAFLGGDAARTAEFFRAYQREQTAITSPAPVASHTQAGNPAPAGSQPTLEDLAAPGRGSAPGAGGGAVEDKRIWTQPAITAFYRDVTKGVYRTRETDRLRIEHDLFTAPAEGRVR